MPDNIFEKELGKGSGPKERELSRIFDLDKVTNSMAFKTGEFILKMSLMLVLAFAGGFLAPGVSDNFTFWKDWSFWMKSGITFMEQTYAFSAALDWFTELLMRTDAKIVGKVYEKNDPTPPQERDIGLAAEFDQLSKEASKDPEALERGRKAWNRVAKIECYQRTVEKWLKKLQSKLRKLQNHEIRFIPWLFRKRRMKARDAKIASMKARIQTTFELITDKQTLDNIDYLTIKGYTPFRTKDLENNEETLSTSESQNSLVNLDAIKAKRLLKRMGTMVITSLFMGLVVWQTVTKGGFGTIAYTLFLILMQAGMGLREAYKDVSRGVIPNYKVKIRALRYIIQFSKKEKADAEALRIRIQKDEIDAWNENARRDQESYNRAWDAAIVYNRQFDEEKKAAAVRNAAKAQADAMMSAEEKKARAVVLTPAQI